jgi:hypothetical protein
MKTAQSKWLDAWPEIERDVKLYVRGEYTKVTVWSLTTSGPIGQGHWVAWQLVWCLGTLTG